MDAAAELIRGLTSNQKRIPYWYIYDGIGDKLYVDICEKSKCFYLHQYTKSLLKENITVSFFIFFHEMMRY